MPTMLQHPCIDTLHFSSPTTHLSMLSLHLMPKPAGAMCNLNCTYCYYLEKKQLYSDTARQEMSDALLERYISQYIALQPAEEVLFTWHGGEPLLRPIAFYEKAIRLQQKYASGKQIANAIQTNGTLLTEDWAQFLKDHNFLTGISIDGTEEMHDHYRKTHSGRGTWKQVMAGIEKLHRHDVEWNAMAVINDFNVQAPETFYDFFKSIDCHYLQFTPIVERFYFHPDGRQLASPIEALTTAKPAPFSVTPEAWGEFLCRIFDRWVRTDVGENFVQIFDATLANWVGTPSALCTMAPTCGHATVIEYNGDVYACDHYVFPEFRLGNLQHSPLASMLYGEAQLAFGNNKHRLLTQQCQRCDWKFACNGDCPRTRFSLSTDGDCGHPYLCIGWQRYFSHVAPAMDYMKHQLLQGKAPANIMRELDSISKI